MKLRADLTAEPPIVELLDDRRAGLALCIHGTLRRAVVDELLGSRGAGRLLGHHAELLIEWLARQSPCQTWPADAAAMGAVGQVDQTGRWMAVPVEWADDSAEPYPSRAGYA